MNSSSEAQATSFSRPFSTPLWRDGVASRQYLNALTHNFPEKSSQMKVFFLIFSFFVQASLSYRQTLLNYERARRKYELQIDKRSFRQTAMIRFNQENNFYNI